MQENRVHRFVSNDFTLRAAVVDATAVVAEMQKIQQTQPIPTVAVGRAMVGALLMASHLKEDQAVGLLFKGNGALASVYAEAKQNGEVRGYVPVPDYDPGAYSESLTLREHMGSGSLTVVRHQPFQKQPHQGTVALVSGEIGEDIAHYLHQSQQIRSIVSLGVFLDSFGLVKAAGGLLVEVMPGVEQELVDKLEKNAQAAEGSISERLLAGATPQDLLEPYFHEIDFTELDHDYALRYHCPCTKERVVDAMAILGVQGLDEMIQDKEAAEVTCQMCGKKYSVLVEELQSLRDRVHRNSLN